MAARGSMIKDDHNYAIGDSIRLLGNLKKFCFHKIHDSLCNVDVRVGEVKLPGKEDEELWSSDMSIRCVNLLLKGGFKTFGDLEKVKGYELLKIGGLGRKTLDEIRSCMRRHGYYFATEGRMLRGE